MRAAAFDRIRPPVAGVWLSVSRLSPMLSARSSQSGNWSSRRSARATRRMRRLCPKPMPRSVRRIFRNLQAWSKAKPGFCPEGKCYCVACVEGCTSTCGCNRQESRLPRPLCRRRYPIQSSGDALRKVDLRATACPACVETSISLTIESRKRIVNVITNRCDGFAWCS
jgi:hypothetical protein